MRAHTLLLGLVVGVVCVTSAGAEAWWESAVIYQIYPRSFKDSNGDGIGDLNGITSKLQYLKDTGVDAIWMSPIYASPMFDFGYDIADYKAIATEYGNMTDFDNLMIEAKKLGIRVVLDYVPNHTSHKSEWFIQSAAGNATYADYYIWADGNSSTTPPNNWISIFRKSAWQWHDLRHQYYLHQFVVEQPDLNYRSAAVQEEMKNVLRFWLNKGVSGFRVDAVNMLYEVEANSNGVYPDEPLSNLPGYNSDDYEYLDHMYTKDRTETYSVVYDWRDVLDEYTTLHNESKIMMTEAYTSMELMMQYYGTAQRNGSIPFNFVFLGELSGTSTALDMNTTITKWMTAMPAGKTANWVNGNHDQSRMASRHGVNRVDAMNMLALLLPGVTITYQGEELGMTDGSVSWKNTQDPQACNTDDPINYWKKSRDPCRTPFHWDNSTAGGFSTISGTWLPMASNYATVNVAYEQAANKSHYKFYKDVVALKHSEPVRKGQLNTTALSSTIFVVTRWLSDAGVLGVINLSSSPQVVDLSSITVAPDVLTVNTSGIACSLEKGAEVKKNSVTMPAYCALALQYTKSSGSIATLSFLLYAILYIVYSVVL